MRREIQREPLELFGKKYLTFIFLRDCRKSHIHPDLISYYVTRSLEESGFWQDHKFKAVKFSTAWLQNWVAVTGQGLILTRQEI